MKMRKIISFVLTLALVLGSFSMAFAATPATTGFSDTNAEAVTVLADLGVVDGYPDGTFKPAGIVTRAEMAKMIVVALGLGDLATATTSSYPDMAGSIWAQGYVTYATSLGIVEGYPDGTFKPTRTVTYNEVCAMIVRALGYTEEFLPGEWPAEWVVKAKTLGILNDVTAATSTGANRADVATMLFNALTLDIGYVNNENTWVKNDTADADTMLARLGAELYSDGDAFLVTKAIADDSVMNLMPYIGQWITAYSNSDQEIIAIKDVKSTLLTGTDQTDGTFKADGVYYSYSTTVNTTASAFTNAKAATTANVGDATGTVTLAVDLSGKTIKEVYSVSTWTVDEFAFFTADDATDITSDNVLFGIALPEDDSNDVDTKAFGLFGADTLSDIAVDSVVYVYAYGSDTANDIIRIEVSTETVSGEVTRISSSDYTIGGTVYSEATDMDSDTMTTVKAGDEVKAFLDYAGDVYKFELVSGEADNYATVINLANGTSGLNGSDPKVEMILQDGTSKVFTADADIADTILAADDITWTGAVTTGAIVKYSLNADGLVDSIVTTSDVTLVIADITASGYMNGYKIASDAVIFTCTTVGALRADGGTVSDDYGITTLAKILDTKDVASRYVLDSGVIVAMIIQADAANATDIYGVVTDYAMNNSDAGYEVDMLIDGSAVTKNAKLAAYTSATTDLTKLYLVAYDVDGNVKTLNDAINSVDSANIEAETSTSGISISGNVVNFATPSGIIAVSGTSRNASITLNSSVVVYTWDANDEVYKKGMIRDIDDAGRTVTFFDVIDTDLIYDFVLVK